MPDSYEKRDTTPITWIGRVPVYAATIVAALELFGLFATAILKALRVDFTYFAFFAPLTWKEWYLWTPLSYPFIQQPSFFSLFSILFLYRYGMDLEGFFGRRVFLRMLISLVLLQPVMLTALWLVTGTVVPLAGSYAVAVGIFIAAATLYPHVEVWNWITMKWLAFAGLFLSVMSYLSDRDWPGMILLLMLAGFAHALVRYERGH